LARLFRRFGFNCSSSPSHRSLFSRFHQAIRKEQEVEIQAIRTGVRAGGSAGRVKSKMITGAAQA